MSSPRRYGLGGDSPETLDAIGADYGLTRERIRQIEKKTIAAAPSTYWCSNAWFVERVIAECAIRWPMGGTIAALILPDWTDTVRGLAGSLDLKKSLVAEIHAFVLRLITTAGAALDPFDGLPPDDQWRILIASIEAEADLPANADASFR